MGCRRYSAANRLEVPLDEDDFRSFSQALELGKCSASFTSACDNPGTLKSMSYFLELNERLFTGLPVLISILFFTFSSASTRNFVYTFNSPPAHNSPFLLSA